MDDLFEKLKAEPPINTSVSQIQTRDFRSKANASPRRESLPAINSAVPAKPTNKCRSMSPAANMVKSCKILLDRKKMKEFSAQNGAKNEKAISNNSKTTPKSVQAKEKVGNPKKLTPTKAQKKLFEPIEKLSPPVENKNNNKNNTTPFKVRIKRQNLEKLREEVLTEKLSEKMNNSRVAKNSPPVKNENENKKKIEKSGVKRKTEAVGESPPIKRGRHSKTPQKESPTSGSKKSKPSKGFFIKINSSPPSPRKQASSKRQPKPQSQLPITTKDKLPRKVSPRLVTSSPVYMTKATKFTRTQLIKSFGKRYFNSFVKIQHCNHPLMKKFDLKARTLKQQAKDKSKNLSVSFKEQVEIIGCSDTESNDSEETSTKERKNQSGRPQKMENGKTIDDIDGNDDIEIDPKLFADASMGSNSSTPLRKKPEKKSYSPLKDDSGSSSARSEQLKLANEKLPPCGLRNLDPDSDNENDNDNDNEDENDIVPADLPSTKKCNSHTTAAPTVIINNEENLIVNSEDASEYSKTDDPMLSLSLTQSDNEEEINENVDTVQDPSDKVKPPTKFDDSDDENEAENNKEDKHINSNGCQTKKTESKEYTNGNNLHESEISESFKNIANDSCEPNSPLTTNTQENMQLVKTLIGELSRDIDISDMNINEPERSSSVNVITA